MNDPAIFVVYSETGEWIDTTRTEDNALRVAHAITGRRVIRYLPESQQPPLAFCSGEPCTVMSTHAYEKLRADAEKWLKVENAIKELGIVT